MVYKLTCIVYNNNIMNKVLNFIGNFGKNFLGIRNARWLVLATWILSCTLWLLGPVFVALLGGGGWVAHLVLCVVAYFALRNTVDEIDSRLTDPKDEDGK